MACDIIGQRSLRYYCVEQSLFISSHDIPIIATGTCEVDLNVESAASILSFDWSLSGESLIKGIKNCHPNEYIVWSKGNTELTERPLLKLDERLDSRDYTSCNAQIDLMIEKMRDYVRNICGGESVVDADLTAGIDSRAIIGIILSVINTSQLRVHTAGAHDSLDVKVARYIARLYGAPSSAFMPHAPTIERFSDYSNLLAFAMNGDTNSKRAVADFPTIDVDCPPHFKGLGGEIYRGYYYPSRSSCALVALSTDEVVRILERKFPRIYRLPWQSEELAANMKKKLQTVVYAYCDMSEIKSDLIDLFYLYERLGQRGALDMRGTWFQKYVSPFSHPGVVKLAFKLPAPIGSSYGLHKTIIKRFLPELYHLPINSRDFLVLLGESHIRRLGRFITHGIDYVYRKKIKARFLEYKIRSHEEFRAVYFTTTIRDNTYDLMLKDDSFSIKLFGKMGQKIY